MKKALAPMLVSLALCGAAATIVAIGSARAQATRPPVRVAMMTSGTLLAANTVAPLPPPDGRTGMRMPTPAEMSARHKQMCEDAYAHQVGDLAYLEAKLTLTPAEQPLFDRWKSVKLDIAKRGQADCATRELPMRRQTGNQAGKMPTPLEGMAREEDLLKRRLADLDEERPVLSAFYNALTDSQKMALVNPGPEALMNRHRMMADALAPDMARRPGGSNRPPMPDAPPPPPQ